MYASDNGCSEIVTLLLESGADPKTEIGWCSVCCWAFVVVLCVHCELSLYLPTYKV